eukprot:6004467-Amphidinium_carterae.1
MVNKIRCKGKDSLRDDNNHWVPPPICYDPVSETNARQCAAADESCAQKGQLPSTLKGTTRDPNLSYEKEGQEMPRRFGPFVLE